MSAKEGSRTEPERARAGASRCASDRGVTLTELATTIPKMTAAAMSTENERARFVDFSMDFLFTPPPRPVRRDLVSMFAVHRCQRSEEHTSELQSQSNLVCRLLLEK